MKITILLLLAFTFLYLPGCHNSKTVVKKDHHHHRGGGTKVKVHKGPHGTGVKVKTGNTTVKVKKRH